MQFVTYIIFRIILLVFKFTPFGLVYVYSNITYFLLFKVLKYRLSTVKSNLKKTFPDKDIKFINEITRKFYKNLSDITLEGIKGMTISPKRLIRRYKIINPEVADKYFEEGKSIIGAGSHYANWEWGILSFSIQFKHNAYGLYKPLSNKYIENFLKKGRSKWGMNLIPIKKTLQIIDKAEQKTSVIFMVSDQSPSNINKAIKINFLNQETYCLHGIEKYSKLLNLPIIYGDVQRIKRGFYEIKLSVICETPLQTITGEITNIYMKKLEEIIINKPEDWLWSHKRWKHNII